LTPGLEAVLVLAGAFAAGAVNSTVGGGGLIQLPALMAAYPQASPAVLLGTNKLASLVGTASAVLRYSRHLAIPWRAVLPAAALAFAASLGGAATVRLLPPEMFRPLVPVLLAVLIAWVVWQRDLGAVHAPRRIEAGTLVLGSLLFVALGFFDGFFGQTACSILSARKRALQSLQSTSGSLKFSTWPDASQTLGLMMMDESRPTTSSRERTKRFHHRSRTLRAISVPSGPKSHWFAKP